MRTDKLIEFTRWRAVYEREVYAPSVALFKGTHSSEHRDM